MPKKTFKIDSFQDMYFDTHRNNSNWKLEPRNQPERTLAPVMRITQTDDVASGKGVTYVNKVDKKQYGFLPNRDVIKYVVDNSGASELGTSGQGSGMRETNTMPRVRPAPVRKPQNPSKSHNVEWLDKMSTKSFKIIKESAESPLLVPHRDYNDSFIKRVTPGEGHRPFMRHKEPGEGISKIPVSDLPTKPFFETSPKVLKRFKVTTTNKKKSFNLQADTIDRAYKNLHKN